MSLGFPRTWLDSTHLLTGLEMWQVSSPSPSSLFLSQENDTH